MTRLLERARLTEILATLVGRRAATEEGLNARLASLQREVVDADDKLKRLYKHLTSGSIPFRKAYLQSIIDAVEVDDAQNRIRGSKDVLEKAVLASRSGTLERSQVCT